MRFKFLTLTISLLALCAFVDANPLELTEYKRTTYERRHNILNRSEVPIEAGLPTRSFKVLPVKFPEDFSLPGVTTKGSGGGKKLEIVAFSLTLRNGQQYEFGIGGGEFSYLDPFVPIGNKNPYNFSLCVQDHMTKFSLKKRPFLKQGKNGRKQTLSRVKLEKNKDATELTISIRYDPLSRAFVANGVVPWDWTKENRYTR